MGRLNGKVAIVTGAGRGIGKGIALKMATEGAKIVVCDLIEDIANQTVKDIEAVGTEAIACVGNITDDDYVISIFAAAIEKFGKIDIVVNNAGMNKDGMLHKMENDQWDSVINVNLTATFKMTREATKILRAQKSGAIINIASMSWMGNLGQANYAASKAGVVGLTMTASRELARNRVTANVICPGFIETDMTKGMSEDGWNMMIGKVPMGYAGTAEDVGNMVAFLGSDEAKYITGQIIEVSGGMKI